MKELTTYFTASNGQEYDIQYILSDDGGEGKITGLCILEDDEDYRFWGMNDLQKIKYMIDIEQQWLKSIGLSLMKFDESVN